MKRYFLVWLKSASLRIQTYFEQRGASLMFIAGKFIRFGFFLLLLLLIGERVTQVSGYNLTQLISFFLFFNLFDMFGQTFFRGLYYFRQQVISGELDLRLVKPINTLFQVLTSHTDILDIPLFIVVLIVLIKQNIHLSFFNFLFFLVLAICGFIIITAIHIFVAGLGIITTEVDHTIMIYRDLSSMARIPIDVYAPPIRSLLTFIIPIAIAYTLPAKAFLGLLSPIFLAYSIFASAIFFSLSIFFWRYALTQYSSASS